MVELSNYLLEVLHKDAEFVLYRGRTDDRSDLTSVLLLEPVSKRPALENLKRLEHEYSLRHVLDPAWAVRPLALSHYRGQTVLVLEDPGGEPLDRYTGGPMAILRFLRLSVGLVSALSQLHKCDLIHKDLKPSNVLVDTRSGEVRLMGFGIASPLPHERQAPASPVFIAGTLPYMAPEQTGCMNRSIDSRSDLYSLGVMLYEMLTGSLPFTASDPMEWVHCHVARQPVPPDEQVKSIPNPISSIVMKLLAKTAEERYQTAAGVENDLRACLRAWESLSRIDRFVPGGHDTPDRLLIPEKLYGRAFEIDVLRASFERVARTGKPGLVLVSGYSGIGKSSVVNEFHKSLAPPRGLFASGKFDQYKRDVPYATLAQAFQSLIRPLLSKSEVELSKWRDALKEALGPNGPLMMQIIPELRFIIGEQPPVPEVPPQDAQGRFQLVVRRFIGVFARPEHPLTLFLDDLQWLDAATLDLIETLLTRPDDQHLLLIGAYRDNEVGASHPLVRKLHAMRQAGVALQEIVLAPLSREDLEELIADSVHCGLENARPLTQLVQDKTGGNPFFAIQFMSALAQEGLLTFDHGKGNWHWDLNRIDAKGYTDNVVDLMIGRLSRLPTATQNALQQLACLGNSAEFTLLRKLFHDSNKQMHDQLWAAVRMGLVFRSENSYTFLHDRVQEAAYSLIPAGSRAETHLRIGRLLAAETTLAEREERVFEIVNQLNRGSHLITSVGERERVAALNLIAGRRAKVSTAYVSALSYLRAGRALLTEDTWGNNYELMFSTECLTAECEVLSAEMAAAERRLSMLAQRAKSGHDIAFVTRLRLTLYTTLDRSDRGVEVFLDYLRRSGTEWPLRPTRDEVMREYDRIWSLVGSRQIEEFVDLPLITDPTVLDVLDVFTEAVTPSLFFDENLCSLVICHMVNLTLQHGNSDASCFAYVWFAIIAGPRFGNYKDGFRFGQLGYELVDKRGLKRYEARTYMSFGHIVMPWGRHARSGRPLIRRAFEAAKRIGDLTFATYCCDMLNANLLTVGDSLVDVLPEAEEGLAFAQKARFGLVVDLIQVQVALIRNLLGLTSKFGSFNNADFDELEYEHHLGTGPGLALPACWYFGRKAQARFLAGDYDSAVDASLRAQRLAWTSPSQFEVVELLYYGALAHAACWDSATPDQRQQHLEALTTHHKKFDTWAKVCPENFDNRAALLGAEIARIEGREFEAMRLYKRAIRSAHENEFVQNEAIAYEVAARFYASRGFDEIAQAYLKEARYCYLRWGADGKVRQLEEQYPDVWEEELAAHSPSTIGAPIAHLDLATVLKVSQAISGEMVQENLVDTLMRTAIEHAGAERGLLILAPNNLEQVEAEATIIGNLVVVHRGAAASSALPQSIIHFVVRTRDWVILEDAATHTNPFSSDPYIRQRRARSILCLPLSRQDKLTGVLYLENNLMPNVFTPTRIAVLKLLAFQAAISLENTSLYTDLEVREAKIRRLFDANKQAEQAFRLLVVGTAATTGSDFFQSLVQHMAQALCARYAFVTTCDDQKHARTLAFWRGDGFGENFEFDIADTPCKKVLHGELCHYRQGLQGLFPLDKALADWQAESYLGVPMLDHSSRVIGHIAIVDDKLMEADPRSVDLLKIFASRAAAELKRQRAEDELQAALQERERLRGVQADLAHINRVSTMGELAASLAHEIKQPISAAITDAQTCVRWLARDHPDLAEAQEAASRLIKDATRAGDIINRIGSLFKKGAPRREVLDLNEAIQEMIALLRSEAGRYSIAIRSELANHLPTVMADRVQVQQVLMNLMLNGIEAVKDTGAPGVLTITSQRQERQLLVSVSDTGVGLKADQVERIFHAFYTSKPQGTGMGLPISRSIVESHGGRLWATPTSDSGTTVQFTLPIEVTAEEAA